VLRDNKDTEKIRLREVNVRGPSGPFPLFQVSLCKAATQPRRKRGSRELNEPASVRKITRRTVENKTCPWGVKKPFGRRSGTEKTS